MARGYSSVDKLALEIDRRRASETLTYEALAKRADVHLTTAFRICRGDFKTLNPGVLRICKVLRITPPLEGLAPTTADRDELASMLQSEVILAWDRTPTNARVIRRVLRALSSERGSRSGQIPTQSELLPRK